MWQVAGSTCVSSHPTCSAQSFPVSWLTARTVQRADVQKAIHARVGTKWESCTGKLNYTEQNFNMLDYLDEIFEKKPELKILYFTGGTMCRLTHTAPSSSCPCALSSHRRFCVASDVDIATVPFAYTQFCLNALHRPIVKKWKCVL